jgi:HK97 gp10 family phage protein
MSQAEIELRGLEETQRKLEQVVVDLSGPPILNAMRDATLLVQGGAKRSLGKGPLTPGANTGRLRASITPQVVVRTNTVTGIVGSNVLYAPYVEFGTRPHWPPRRPLIMWAARKLGLTGVELRGAVRGIQRKIAHHGTKGLHYLQNAFDDNKNRIAKVFEATLGRIVRK